MSQLTQLQQNEVLPTPRNASTADLEMLNQQGVDVWGILSRRKWLVIMGLILGTGLGYIYLLQASPVYESLAQVLIEDKKPPTIPLTGVDNQLVAASAEAKHAIMIVSPRILTQAFDEFKLDQSSTFRDDEDPLVTLSKQLAVELVEEGTNVLNISYRGPNPEDTRQVVNAIVQTYEKFLQGTYKDTGLETRDLIVKAKDDLMTKVEGLEKEYRNFKATTPLMYRGAEAVNMHQERQADYEKERILLLKQITQLKARIQAVREAIRNKQDLESVLLLAEQDGTRMMQDRLTSREVFLRDRYLVLLLKEEELKSQYGSGHPDLVTVQRQLKRYEELFPDVAQGKSLRHTGEDLKQFVVSYVGSLKQRQTQLQAQYEQLSELFVAEEAAAKELQRFQAQDEQFRNEIERTQQLFAVVVKSLEEISLVTDYEGYNFQRLAEPAIGEQVAPMVIKVIPISGLLGIFLGFGVAYLVDISDKAFRTPDEVSSVMGLPVVGHVPMIDVEKVELLPGCDIEPVMVTVHRPKSPQSESYRAVRTALYFNSQGERHQVIQVTSPMPGDGKSTLASNLAVTIAQSGRSVLLLDADFRRPTQHKVFAIDDAGVGLASVVAGDTEPADAWRSVPHVPNLSIMACGPRPDNPSELLSSEEFADVLNFLREQFDFVIVDTPPVLAVSDPCAVAARVDGVILTFRIHKRAKPLAVRARDALTSIGASVIGVVVNGVDQDAGGYYSQYHYGYAGYRYSNTRYGYSGYGSEAEESEAIREYYDEEVLTPR